MKGELSRKKKESAGKQYPIIPLEGKKDSTKITGEYSKDTLVFLVDRRGCALRVLLRERVWRAVHRRRAGDEDGRSDPVSAEWVHA